MAAVMHTKFTVWSFNDVETKWYGVCKECKGEKAKFTPQTLKNKGIKPCETCTNVEMYEAASENKESL